MGNSDSMKARNGRTVSTFSKMMACLATFAAFSTVIFCYFTVSVAAAAPASQDFEDIPAGTESSVSGSLTFDGLIYSTDAAGDIMVVDTVENITAYPSPSLGSGNGLSSAYNGTDPSATYFQFASVSNGDNFKLTALNAEVWGHGSANSEIYRIDGYDDGVIKATATVDFAATSTYGLDDNSVSYTRLSTQYEIDNSGNGGLLSFTGSAWGNIDQVRMTVADSSPNTFMTVMIDNLMVDSPVFPPSSTTSTASNVSYTSATLNSTVNDNGTNTTVTFDYGTTASYGMNASATTGGTVVAGTGNTAASVDLTSLSPNTTYHYRVKAVSSAGTAYGSDQTFTTLAPAQTATVSVAATSPVAGAANSVTLTVNNSLGNTDTTFNGAHDVAISGYTQAPNNTFGSFNGTALTASPNTVSVTFTNGEATVDLSLNDAALQTIGFSITGVSTPATNTLGITPAAGDTASMAVTTAITAPASNGGVFAQQAAITLLDAYGNINTSDNTSVITASKKDGGAWTLTGTTTATASSGIATFTNLGGDNAASVSGAQLAFDAAGLTQVTSAAVTLPAPAPAQTAAVSAAATSPVAGAANSVTLTVNNSLGNTDTTFNGAHDVAVSGYTQAPNNSFGGFNGTALTASPNTVSVVFTNGEATVDLSLNHAALQTIGFSITGVSTPATNTLGITPAAGDTASMAVTTAITAPASNGGVFAQQAAITLLDAYGNISTSDNTSVITASKSDGGAWTLTGTTTATASSGIATFTNLGADNVASVSGAQLAFDAAGLTQVTSAAVTLPAPAPAQTAAVSAAATSPVAGAANSVTLTVKNTLGNTDTTFNGAHDVAVSGYTQAPNNTFGSFNGTALTASPNTVSVVFTNGEATVDLSLNDASLQTIGFSITGVATPATNTLGITPAAGDAASMAVTTAITAPASNGGVFAQQAVITLLDAYGNVSAGDNTSIITASKTDGGAWTLTGTTTATASSGIATFTNLGADNEASVSGAQLAFDAAGLTQVTSAAVTLPAPAPAQTAAVSAAATSPVAGATNSVTLTVKNALGNTDTTFNGAHDVAISGYTQAPNNTFGSFNGTALTASPNTVSVTFTNGEATVDLSLNDAALQTIGFSITGVSTPATNTLGITPAAGDTASMAVTTGITAPASNGGVFAQQAVITLLDAYGNVSAGDNTSVITASKTDGGAWTLTGTTTATASSGIATFTNLGADNAASVSGAQLAFDAAGLTQVTSGTVNLPWPTLSAPTITSITVGDGHATISWSEVYGAAEYAVFQGTASGAYGAAVGTTSSSIFSYDATGLSNGTTYYFVVKAANPGGEGTASMEKTGTPRTVAAAPTDISATAGDRQATIVFKAPTVNGGSPITGYEVTASPGDIIVKGTASPITITGLENGTSYTFTVKAINEAGSSVSSSISNSVIPFSPPSSNPSVPSPSTSTPTTTGADVLVNGKVENAGTVETAKVNDQTITTIAVDQSKLEERLKEEAQGAVITIPVATKSDVVVGRLNGQMIQNLEGKQAIVVIQTEDASYSLPAQQVNIHALADQFGENVALQDIRVQIEIEASTTETLKVAEDSASKGDFTVVVPPFNFKVTATYGDKTIEVSRFNTYVERSIAIPDGVDPNKITTGIVIEPDGTVRHVPTKIVSREGKYYAQINSVTNSTYVVVWHPLTFTDVAQHWAKAAVNDMGSRMIISGIGNDRFNPDQDITRAEFAAIVVRGLGLKLESGSNIFTDVKSSDWYSSAIQTATAYGLITGYEDGTFGPMDKITREQAMMIIAKAMKVSGLKAKLPAATSEQLLNPFVDAAHVSEWAKSSVADSIQGGIVSGRSNAHLEPKANITRAEVAVIVQKLLQKSDLI
ncbi:hypothetical protein PAECIP111893_03858 [Paenibacillus plantiphilus]|uniref:S-layer homology domain-containing protein n=1 Tax=Paenibacillus plantiphilus TaxID=2905650 RepID=A0ABM9CIC4_9BACL|nr:S-layer homology domain-containing protein [Paenibacillus plantiphilus]CAH1214857.1 hypothetical protein PAECIP111893_03858 [Paenibacillus plantiphilus]